MEIGGLEQLIPIHPLARVPERWQVFVFLGFLAASVALLIVLYCLGEGLKTDRAPCGIVSLELAGCRLQVEQILDEWKRDGEISRARRSLALDFLFIPAYAGTLSLLCLWGARLLGTTSTAGSAALELLAWGQLLAGGLDFLENILLLLYLSSPYWSRLALLVASLAGTKFLLIGMALPAVVVAIVVSILQ